MSVGFPQKRWQQKQKHNLSRGNPVGFLVLVLSLSSLSLSLLAFKRHERARVDVYPHALWPLALGDATRVALSNQSRGGGSRPTRALSRKRTLPDPDWRWLYVWGWGTDLRSKLSLSASPGSRLPRFLAPSPAGPRSERPEGGPARNQ